MTWLGRDALGRVTDFSAESATTDADDPPDITVGGTVTVQSRTVTLTDAQIKALPTVAEAPEIVPAPGAGSGIEVVRIILHSHITSVYTNINAAAYIWFMLGDSLVDLGYYLNQTTGLGFSFVSSLLADANDDVYVSHGPGVAYDSTTQTMQPSVIATSDKVDNKPLRIKLDNAGAGNLTGGNAVNTLKVTVLYMVIDL